MDDELSENTALHVLGLLTGDAKVEFEKKLSADPALRAEWCTLREAAATLALSAPRHEPPADLREKILADFREITSTPNLTVGPVASPKPGKVLQILRFLPWAAAAALAVLLHRKNTEATAQGLEAENLQRANDGLSELVRQHLADARASEAAAKETTAALEAARADLKTMEERASLLDREKSLVAAELETLRRDSQLDRTRIAVLKSLVKTQSKALAVSVWRQETQQGLLVVENLPVVPAGRDYQLWIIDPNHPTPVSAGVFKVDATGKNASGIQTRTPRG